MKKLLNAKVGARKVLEYWIKSSDDDLVNVKCLPRFGKGYLWLLLLLLGYFYPKKINQKFWNVLWGSPFQMIYDSRDKNISFKFWKEFLEISQKDDFESRNRRRRRLFNSQSSILIFFERICRRLATKNFTFRRSLSRKRKQKNSWVHSETFWATNKNCS